MDQSTRSGVSPVPLLGHIAHDDPTPDRVMRLADCHGILRVVARHGVYTFTESATGERVRVIR